MGIHFGVDKDYVVEVTHTAAGARQPGLVVGNFMVERAGAAGEAGVEEHKALVRRGYRARLQDITAAAIAARITQRADLTLFKQRYAVVAPDEIHVAGDQAAVEPAITLDLNGVLFGDKVGVSR